MRRRIAVFLVVGLLLTGVPVLSACGGGEDRPESTSTPSVFEDVVMPDTQTVVSDETTEASSEDPLGDEVEGLLQELEDANSEADDLGDVSELE